MVESSEVWISQKPNLRNIPHSFMSKGNEKVDDNLSKDIRNEYLEKVLLPNGLVKELAICIFFLP